MDGSQEASKTLQGGAQDHSGPPLHRVTAVHPRAVSPKSTTAIGLLACAIVAAYAVWYSSAGRFPFLPRTPNDYVDLGDSFLHGQLALREVPDPRLALLPNPYDYKERLGLPYHWDASYYNGHYYLYWGPVPALVSAALELAIGALPSGALLVLLPFVGLLVVLLLFLIQVSRWFSSSASSLSIGLFILVGLVNLPMLFLVGQPRIYEASILYGQFFLLAGVTAWVYHATAQRPGFLALAGLNWGLAVGCRYNLIVSVGIMVILAALALSREEGLTQSWRKLGLLLVPIALCCAALAAYNSMRFGNPLETGFTYQLTIPEPAKLYSISYAASNVYVYFLYPLTTADKFPFIKSALFNASLLPSWLQAPAGSKFDHVIVGLLPSAPALWLIALAFPALLLKRREAGRETPRSRNPALNALLPMLSLAAAAQVVHTLVFFYGAERYIADFYVSLVLIAAILAWRMDERFRARSWLRLVLWSAVVCLAAWTICIGYFGSFGIPPRLFRSNNLELYAQLASYWGDRYDVLQAVLHKAGLILSGSRAVP